MAVAVASGKSWFGCKVKQGPVLYILGEGGVDMFRRRVGEACNSLEADIKDLPLWVRAEALDLSERRRAIPHMKDGWDDIYPQLIVVDTLSRCMPGDENSQEIMQGFVHTMDFYN